MDESLQLLRALSEGKPVSCDGEFFSAPRRADPSCAVVPHPDHRRRPLRRRGAACRPVRRWLAGHLGLASTIRRGGRPGRRARRPSRAGTRPASSMRSTSGAASVRPEKPPARRSQLGCTASTRCRSSPSSAIRRTGHPRTSPSSSYPYVEAGCSVFNVIPCARRPRDRCCWGFGAASAAALGSFVT